MKATHPSNSFPSLSGMRALPQLSATLPPSSIFEWRHATCWISTSRAQHAQRPLPKSPKTDLVAAAPEYRLEQRTDDYSASRGAPVGIATHDRWRFCAGSMSAPVAQAGPRKGPSVPRVILMAVLKFSEIADWSSREMKTVSSVIFRWGAVGAGDDRGIGARVPPCCGMSRSC